MDGNDSVQGEIMAKNLERIGFRKMFFNYRMGYGLVFGRNNDRLRTLKGKKAKDVTSDANMLIDLGVGPSENCPLVYLIFLIKIQAIS